MRKTREWATNQFALSFWVLTQDALLGLSV